MAITFKRFASFADMLAYAVTVANAHKFDAGSERKAFAESGIYTDNDGVSYRPQVSIVCDDLAFVLRWNAFANQADIDHIGKRARVEARNASDWFTNQIQEAINAATAATPAPVVKPVNPARAALSRAVNRAIANGAPVFVEIPYWERPCAAAGLESYRYRGPYGFIMIGARDHADALKEAARSTDAKIDAGKLEHWNGTAYAPVETAPVATARMTCKRCETVNPFSYFAPVAVSETESVCTCHACADAAGFLTKSGDLKPGYSL